VTGTSFDVIVVGSGFGGAVTACRLAEAGYRVLVLERGRRWDVDSFPREPGDPWLWNDDHPAKLNGWIDFRMFRKMAVAQAAGVGGGSLVYANISVDADRATFDEGWPPEITYDELAPHYHAVASMMNVQPIPRSQWPPRTELMHEAATAVGAADRFRALELAVTFDPTWRPDAPDAFAPSSSRTFVNAQGREQGTCIHLGECPIGCKVRARNTLDLNYLARAETLGAEVRPLSIVRTIEPADGGYRVHVERIVGGDLQATTETARIVVVAAGSLGSTELLLRARDVTKTLPGLPRTLGAGWSSNGDFLTIGWHDGRNVDPTRGPTITSAIDYRDGSSGGRPFFIEDGGFPSIIRAYLDHASGRWNPLRRRRLLSGALRSLFGGHESFEELMPWFSQGRDAGDGRLRLRPRWRIFGRPVLDLDWDVAASRPTINAIIAKHRELALATGGRPELPITWRLGSYLITPHPLGGCTMGARSGSSVVDHRGEVWGHRNLYVADGAIVPEAIGANPSRTIAALAERIAAGIAGEGR
jgi:cholesterol oxidase